MEVFTRRKFSLILPPALIGENFIPHTNFLSYINDHTENTANFTILAKIYSIEYYKGSWAWGNIFSSENLQLHSTGKFY